MTATSQKKNICLIKNKILKQKFGAFKSVVIKYKQQQLFSTTVIDLLAWTELAQGRTNKVLICHRIFKYLYLSDDLFYNFTKLKKNIKKKLFELVKQDSSFATYLDLFGYQCTYIMRNNKKCGITCTDFICPRHVKCRNRLFERVKDSLPIFDKNIINHIKEYILNKDFL